MAPTGTAAFGDADGSGDTGSGDSDTGNSDTGDTDSDPDEGDADGSGEPAGGDDRDGPGDSGEPPVEVEPPVIPAIETHPAGDAGGPIDATLKGLDGTVGELTGVDPGLSEVTAPVTATVDGVIAPLTGAGIDPAAAPVPETPAP